MTYKLEAASGFGLRLDKWIVINFKEFALTRNQLKKIIDARKLKVNGQIKVAANYMVEQGDVIEFETLEYETDLKPQDIKLDIVYEDSAIIIINKPNELVVHPGAGNLDGTLANALLFHYKELKSVGSPERPGLVHRIDKNTTGLLVVAKTNEALNFLQDELKTRAIKRKYMAIVEGIIKENNGTIKAPIGRDRGDRLRMAVANHGKPSVTHFKVVKRWKHNTLVECELETGRTHQIRVHMAFINHPVVGDYVYGKKKNADSFGQYLHAYKLDLIHPTSKKLMKFEIDFPQQFKYKMKDLDNEK